MQVFLKGLKYNLAVFGCQMNVNDADRLRTILEAIGGKEVEKMEDADLVIYVTCSVKQHAEDRIFGLIAKLAKKHRKERKKPVITAITGCMARKTSSRFTEEKKDALLRRSDSIDVVFRIKESNKLPELLKDFFPEVDEFRGEFPGIFETVPTQKIAHSAFVPISTGCDHHCTYCIVPHTRGKEECRSKKEILAECKALIKKGAQEITLLGQNVNRYYAGERGKNPYRTDFAELLDEVAQLEGLTWLRFLSPHPQHLGEDVIEVMAKHKNICRHLHLPVQHGDDEMLRKMARGYTVEKFRETLQMARERLPDLGVTTDIIVGFCGETEEQHKNSLTLCQKEQFDMIYISKFSVRPNTPAAKWEDDIPLDEKKCRFHEMNEVLKISSKKNNEAEVGKVRTVLVDKILTPEDERENGKIIAEGHTNQSRRVQFQVGFRAEECIGKFVKVKISNAKHFLLEGELL